MVLGMGTATELKGKPGAVHVLDALEISLDTTDTGHSESEQSQWLETLRMERIVSVEPGGEADGRLVFPKPSSV